MDERLREIQAAIGKIRFKNRRMEIREGAVCFGGVHESETSRAAAEEAARALIPWRKGPFQLGELFLDAEWRSDKKWDRLASALPDLKGKTVADVGCNNGYYLYRIAALGARVVGFDPTSKYKLQYDLLAAHAPELPIAFRVAGWQSLAGSPEPFDCIFLMGVNYHDPEPLEIFHACKNALKPGGLLICESVIVPGETDLEIFPAGKYAGIGGVYAMPTAKALMRQLSFAGFTSVTLQHTIALSTDEQRASEFSPQKSFADYLRPDGWSAEGYPPVHRAAILARR